MHNIKLYESPDHLFVFLNESKSTAENGIHSNQFLIKHHKNFVLLDPGGFNVMPHVLAEILRYTTIEELTSIVLSHQDPDVLGGIVSWLAFSNALVYLPEIWKRFVPHCGITKEIHRFHGIPDKGMEHDLGNNCKLQFIPAHFLHSEGNITVYDPVSKILFTADIGAATSMVGDNPFVEDFDKHLPHIEAFHKRYMCSNKAIKIWLNNIAKLEIDMLAPQHGRIYKGKTVHQFLNWFGTLRCGIDLLDEK
jgi:flavorubredoxin